MAQVVSVNVYQIDGKFGTGGMQGTPTRMAIPVQGAIVTPAPANTKVGAVDIYGFLHTDIKEGVHYIVETPAQWATAANA